MPSIYPRTQLLVYTGECVSKWSAIDYICHRFTELFRLKKIFKDIKSKCQPSTANLDQESQKTQLKPTDKEFPER